MDVLDYVSGEDLKEAAVIMAPFLPAAMVVPYTAVWRIFLTYGTVAMGASIMLGWLGKDGAR